MSKQGSEGMSTITAKMPNEVLERFRAMAIERDSDMAKMLRRLVKNELDNWEKNRLSK